MLQDQGKKKQQRSYSQAIVFFGFIGILILLVLQKFLEWIE
jgi:hypothetical protein